jgi:hypothetical protein
MTGPRPAGRPWTPAVDDMLRELLASGMKPRLIAQKLKRSIGAVQSRIFLFKKPCKRLSPKRPLICRFDNSPPWGKCARPGANGVSVARRWGQLRLGAGLAGPNHDRIVKPWALTVNGILRATAERAEAAT